MPGLPTLHPMSTDLLFERAARFGARTAIVDPTGAYSYHTLAARTDAVAAGLVERGVRPGDRVAYLIEPGFDHVAVQWGIWRAGAIAVPLATSHPERELAHVLDDATPSAVVAGRGEYLDRVAGLAGERRIPVSTPGDLQPDDIPTLPQVRAEHPALVIYTSGTTGRPKGVVTTHANLRAQITTLVAAWEWRDTDRSLHVLPLHHIHGVINALSSALWCGAAVEFLTPFDALQAWARLGSGEITFFTAVPTVYTRLIGAWDASDPALRRHWRRGLDRVRVMCSGSAALPVSTLEHWETMTGHRLLERYGMTEIGMALGNPLHGQRRAGTVGVPFPDVALRLVDEAGHVVPDGVVGEIEVQSAQVFHEYWQRPEETAKAFRDGWFITGDVGIREEGYYRLLGRRSVDIIKSAGYKLSALEIEEAIREHPEVADCAVVGLEDADLGEKVAALIVCRGSASVEPDPFRTWLKTRMAAYKVPRIIAFADELPRNAMGKVTKTAVRDALRS